MSRKNELQQLIVRQGVLPLYFHPDENVSIAVLKTLYGAGIRAVEYTNRGEAALRNFTKLRETRDRELEGLSLGIGTIKNQAAARNYLDAGADFMVCPGLTEEVAEVADRSKVLWIPGCMTPSEIIRAENLGARLVKLFPGNILGPGFVSAIRELFPGLSLMPTGGVDLDRENIAGWFRAGVSAVGMGSKLISKALMEQENYARIGELTVEVLEIIRSLRS